MKCTVTGITVETKGMTEEQLEAAKLFSGKNAGICYMGDSYFDSAVTDPEKAMKRFRGTVKNGHHSISDHVRVEVLLENCSKMVAILLNSLQDYATSEKSGRYTKMTGNSEKERELYDKWLNIFRNQLLKIKPDLDDVPINKAIAKLGVEAVVRDGVVVEGAMADGVLADLKADESLPSVKLAQENARYVLGVFTRSTTFGYSTSLRQWNYIYDWCHKYTKQFEEKDGTLVKMYSNDEASYFERELYSDLIQLEVYIRGTMYVENLRDGKGRCFDFLGTLSGGEVPMVHYDSPTDDHLGITYNVSYEASFAQIAQAERHRTLKYHMIGIGDDFFVPPMLEDDEELVAEWLEDLASVQEFIPQATLVKIVEMGTLPNFILKCKERLCGRAQLETMNQTKLTAKRFIDAMERGTLPFVATGYVEQLVSGITEVSTKCQMCGSCSEFCMWGMENALTRRF